MARSLVVWGFDMQDWTQEEHVMLEHGCPDNIEIHEKGNAAWCAACFPTHIAAEACAARLQERFGHLRVCVTPPYGRADTTRVEMPPVQRVLADANPLGAILLLVADWCRCPLSGEVLRDPVVFGREGHSFEREALEEWLAVNPGVHPLSRQPLLPGEGNAIPNHAVRKMLQQLHLS